MVLGKMMCKELFALADQLERTGDGKAASKVREAVLPYSRVYGLMAIHKVSEADLLQMVLRGLRRGLSWEDTISRAEGERVVENLVFHNCCIDRSLLKDDKRLVDAMLAIYGPLGGGD